MVKAKTLKGKEEEKAINGDKFLGNGVMFRCKFFGFFEVGAARGDHICRDAIEQLKEKAKKMNKGGHKQRIYFNISIKGIRIIDEKSQKTEHTHPIHKISYISHDPEEKRNFGYIVSLPEGYQLFAIRAEKNAGMITACLKELFQVVFNRHNARKESMAHNSSEEHKQEDSKEESVDGATLEQKTGIEEKEDKPEEPYAISNVFQTVDDKPDDAKRHYDIPKSTPAFSLETEKAEERTDDGAATANLLDWSDVNDQLEIFQTDIKNASSTELLNEFGLDQPATGVPATWQTNTDSLSNDPFFQPVPGFGSMKTSSSDTNLQQHLNNPFFPNANPLETNPRKELSLSKSKSMDFLFGDDSFGNQSAPTNLSSTGTTDALALENLSMQSHFAGQNSAWENINTVTSNFDAFSSSEPIAQSIPLEPVKPVEMAPESSDPFSVLSGDIQGMKGALPTGGSEAPKFPKKDATKMMTSPKSTSPSNFHQPQMTTSQSNFGQPQMMAPQFNFGQPPQPHGGPHYTQSLGINQIAQNQPLGQADLFGQQMQSSIPPIPPRIDLFSPTSVNAPSHFSPQFPPAGVGCNWQQQGSSMGGPLINPSFPQRADDLIGGQPFSTNDPFSNFVQPDDLYSKVDKSQKSKNNSHLPSGNTTSNSTSGADLMSGFTNTNNGNKSPSLNPFGDAFSGTGSNQASANAGNTSTTTNDPFGDLLF